MLLADQDRSPWDRAQIREAVALVGEALRRSRDRAAPLRRPGRDRRVPCPRPHLGGHGLGRVVSWYDVLLAVDPSPVVALNRAVAVGELAGAAAALDLLDRVSGLDGYAYWHASRAVLLRRLGRDAEAGAADRRAAALPVSEPVRRILDPG